MSLVLVATNAFIGTSFIIKMTSLDVGAGVVGRLLPRYSLAMQLRSRYKPN